jgi:hypothetical protein
MRQVPRLGEVIGPGIDALRARRPLAAEWVERGGRYADVFAGWSGQAALELRYLADQVASARLKTSRGGALTALARSEFETARTPGATAAFGIAAITRPSGAAPGGGIPKGFRFRRDADLSAVPPVPAMTYTTTREVPVALGQLVVPGLPVQASRAGSDGNAPYIADAGGALHPLGALAISDTPFDRTFAVSSFDVGGGADGESDADLVAQATAYATGQYGPVLGAVVAGALRGTGVHRIAVQDVTQDTAGARAAFTGVVVADASWGFSSAWLAAIQQKIADEFQGFGCTLRVTGPSNVLVAVSAAVTLRSADSLSFTDEITTALQAAARGYFDDRPDWYTWRLAGLRAALSHADRRILACTSAAVTNAVTGASLAEPAAALGAAPGGGLVATHYLLASGGVSVAYAAPL